MRIFTKHYKFILFFSVTILVFLYSLIIMRASFLKGDNFVQFYPWMKAYSAAIKNLTFSFWIHQIQSGFPLVAEGQTGVFYPLNILIFYLLPFNLAYNYSIILHFILGGIFTYLYARKIGADQEGGYLASLIFCFGSAYAGCFYNIVSLRTLCWFGCVLYCFELFLTSKKLLFLFLAGLVSGMQYLAGFAQLAAYSYYFYLVYFIYRLINQKTKLSKIPFFVFFFSIISALIFLPQAILTYKLAVLSGRPEATLGFALWRSFMPLGFLGIIFPYSALPFNSSNFYIGVLSLFFVIYALLSARQPEMKGLILILILAIFFALGKYNPLYVVILKLLRFYSLRNPSKFLFFASFSLAVLSGYGFSCFYADQNRQKRGKAAKIFRRILIIAAVVFLIFSACLWLFKLQIVKFGQWYAEKFIFGQSYHRYSLEHYLNQINQIYANFSAVFSLNNPFVIAAFILLFLNLVFLSNLLKSKRLSLSLIFIDLFIFSFYGIGFRGNIRPFGELAPQSPQIFAALKSDKQLYRIAPFMITDKKMPNWALPNANITYDIDSIACYAPLASREYKNKLQTLEVVDDSLGLRQPGSSAIDEHIQDLKLLNVKYIISPVKLPSGYLSEIMQEGGVLLYCIKDFYPRVFVSDSLDNPVPGSAARLAVYQDGYARVEISEGKEGYLVFSEFYYPGWQALVDNQRREIIKVNNLVQAVKINKGEQKVIFQYKPW